MKRLRDGECKVFKAKFGRLDVVAEREDCDTPYIRLQGQGLPEGGLRLTDAGAQELVENLKKALSILPTSK